MSLFDEPSLRERTEAAQATRLSLWRAACHKEIGVEELYAQLARLRKDFGSYLYPERSIQAKRRD